MSREREFDALDALNKSMTLFWCKGYQETSMGQLVKVTGVSRYGLYQEFSSKKELFKRCLHEYEVNRINPELQLLAKSSGKLEDLKRFFYLYRENITANGCLICNTAVEMSDTDVDINSYVVGIYNKISKIFQDFIKRSQELKEIKVELNAFDLSICLLGVMQGVAVMAKSDFHSATLQQYLTTIFNLMETPNK